jgi:molybdate transport system substrate-binding protein
MKKTALLVLSMILLLIVATVATSFAAPPDEIKVMSSGGFAAPLPELILGFESATHSKVVVITTSMGLGQNSIPNRIRSGESVDVVILPDEDLKVLIHDGLIITDTRVALANSRIGMAVRSGTPKPDISTVEALKRTLLQAKSIAYSAQVSGEYLSTELFPRLGISEQIKHKSKRVEVGRVGSVIARGEAEIGFQQISELLPIQGIDYVGPLPAEVQRVTLFSAGVSTSAKNVGSARAFIGFLASQKATSTVTKTGLEPLR